MDKQSPIPPASRELADVLVLSVRKGFWAAPEAQIFPHRIYTRRLFPGSGRWGSSRNPVNNLSVLIEGYLHYLRHRPKVILIGSANRAAPWFANLKRAGLLPGTHVIATTQSYLSDAQVAHLASVIVYSRKEIALHDASIRHKYAFVPLPADGDYTGLDAVPQVGYIFSGGGAGRDFATLIDAVRGLDVPLRIVTFSPETLGYAQELPENCTVEWRMGPRKFLERLAAAKFVVVPLIRGEHPHGHTTVVQALRLGKPVITTSNASVEDYVRHEREGLLVEPGDVDGYRAAILRLEQDDALWQSCQAHACRRAAELTYAQFAQSVVDICREVLADDR